MLVQLQADVQEAAEIGLHAQFLALLKGDRKSVSSRTALKHLGRPAQKALFKNSHPSTTSCKSWSHDATATVKIKVNQCACLVCLAKFSLTVRMLQCESVVMLEEMLPGRLPFHHDIDTGNVYYPAAFWTVVEHGVHVRINGTQYEIPMNDKLVMLDDTDWDAVCLWLNPRSVKNGVTRNTPPGMHIVRIPFRGIQSDSEIRVNLVRTSGNVTVKFERHMAPMAMWVRMMQAMKLS